MLRTPWETIELMYIAVSADDLPHLHRFVRGVDTDHAAVRNGLTLPYSSGAVEGHVNRIILWNLVTRTIMFLLGLTREPKRRYERNSDTGEQVAGTAPASAGDRLASAMDRFSDGFPERSTPTRRGLPSICRCASGRVSIRLTPPAPISYLCAGADRMSQPPRTERRVHRLRLRVGECGHPRSRRSGTCPEQGDARPG